MVVMSKETYESLKINCPRCNNLIVMGSVKNKNLNIVQIVKDKISYICVKCVGKTGDFKDG